MSAPKKFVDYITHVVMHYPEVENTQVDFANFRRIHHMFENHTNNFVGHF
jgi:hypothetical protein